MPSAVSFVAKIAFGHMHEKMREGIKIYSSLDDLKIIDKSDLPDIFGGSIPLKSITG